MGTLNRHLSTMSAAAATAALLVTSVVPAAAGNDASTAALPNLAASPVAVVDMTCVDGQTDLNNASAETLMDALGLNADDQAVAERVVAMRPHHGLPDLLAVPGVGNGRLDHLNPAAFCAGPVGSLEQMLTTVPPDVCPPGDHDLVDPNTATADELTEVLPGKADKTRPTAERLVARAAELPFSTLDHLVAVPGVGPGNLDRIRDRLCLNAAPVLATDADGQSVAATLVTRTGGVSVTLTTAAGPFTLGVPAETITDDHTWATVTAVPDASGLGYDVADMHVHGPWAGVVWPTVPARPAVDTDTVVDALVHITSDGATELVQDQDADPLTVTAPVTSLSWLHSALVPFRYFTAPSTTTSPTAAREALGFILEVLDVRTTAPDCPASGVSYAWNATVSGTQTDDGELLWCDYVRGGDARHITEMAHNRNTIAQVALLPENGPDGPYLEGEFTGGSGRAPATPAGLAIQRVFGNARDGVIIAAVAPGGSFEIQNYAPTSTVRGYTTVNVPGTVAYVTGTALLDGLFGDSVAYGVGSAIVECAYPKLVQEGAYTPTSAVAHIYDCVATWAPDLIEKLGREGVADVIKGSLLLFTAGVSIYDTAVDFVEGTVALVRGDDSIRIDYSVPNNSVRPWADRYGRRTIDECLTRPVFDPATGWSEWTLDQGCQDRHYGGTPDTGGDDPVGNDQGGDRFMAQGRRDGRLPALPDTMGKVYVIGRGALPDGYVSSDGSFRQVYDEATLTCKALNDRIPVRYDMPQDVFEAWVETPGPWPIDQSGCTQLAAVWLSDGLTNWIVRNVYNGESYLLDASGTTIRPITTGTAFNCLAQSYLVYETTNPTGRTRNGQFVNYAVGPPATC